MNLPSTKSQTLSLSYVRDHGHEERMRRLSECGRSIEHASEQLGRACDPDSPAGPTTRRGFIEAIANIAKGIARWVERLTGGGGTASTPGPK